MTASKFEIPSASLDTILQHAGKEHRLGRGLVGAQETSVTYRTPDVTDTPVYSRLGNTTNHKEVESLLSSLHGSESAIVTGSGMAAEILIFLTLAKPGDHVLFQDVCYGGTYNLFTKILKQWGITCSFGPVSEWESLIQPETKFVFIESISNPFCIPQNISDASAFARRHKLVSVCDNTFASPLLCRPLEAGIDLVFESATKYLNGHSDVIAGFVAGSEAILGQLRSRHAYLGTFLPPAQCVQLLRGMRSLSLRMAAHCQNGLLFSESLRKLAGVNDVYYGCAPEDSAAKSFPRGFGGMVAVRFSEDVDMKTLLSSFRLISDVPSLGGTESTATCPAFTTNWFMTEEQKQDLGISTHLIRFSIGLENPHELIADVSQAIHQAT